MTPPPPDRSRPNASARRKRIVESVITEPIRSAAAAPKITQRIETSPVRPVVPTLDHAAGKSARSRPRRGDLAPLTHSSDYSLEVQPITPAAIDRKDKYAITPRVVEIAAKVTELGEQQRIKCFGCIEDEGKRERALEEYQELLALGQTEALSTHDLQALQTPVKCMYYDPAERGLIKGVRMSDLNYGRCANCMTHGRGCWWPTESLAAPAAVDPASASVGELGHVVDEETNSKRSKRIESRRGAGSGEPVKRAPRKGKSASVQPAQPSSSSQLTHPAQPPSSQLTQLAQPMSSSQLTQPSQPSPIQPAHSYVPRPAEEKPSIPAADPAPVSAPADPPSDPSSDPANDTNAALVRALMFMQNYEDDDMDDVEPAPAPTIAEPVPAVVQAVGEPAAEPETQVDNTAGEQTIQVELGVQDEEPTVAVQAEVEPAVNARQEIQVEETHVGETHDAGNVEQAPVEEAPDAALQAEEHEAGLQAEVQNAGLQSEVPEAGTDTNVQVQVTTETTTLDTPPDAATTTDDPGTTFETQYSFLFQSQEETPADEMDVDVDVGVGADVNPQEGDSAEEMAMNDAPEEPSASEPRGDEDDQDGQGEMLEPEPAQQEADFVPETQRQREASGDPAETTENVEPAEQVAVKEPAEVAAPPAAIVVETEPIEEPTAEPPADLPAPVAVKPNPFAPPDDDGADIIVLGATPAATAPSTLPGRTRPARSTRIKTSAANNKRRPPVPAASDAAATDSASYHLTQKWIDRLPEYPEPDIVIVETSVPLRYDNTNLMSLDLPGVQKVFRKCTGCTLRECECAPLPVTEEQQSTAHSQYRQNTVLDSAGCLTCRICRVVCSFTLDPPIYGEFASLPSPRTLDDMKLLPEDWDTRSTLDGFEGHDEDDTVNGNGNGHRPTETRVHADPTFLQSNKCSGCILRQCLCIALPAGEGRGGGCVKCQECNVACSFGVATPKADGKTVVWADADSTKTGGRALTGAPEKRTNSSKRRVLAAASDDEDAGRADGMQVDE